MKKRFIILLSALILILLTFITVKSLIFKPQEQTTKKEISQTRVKKVETKKEILNPSQENSSHTGDLNSSSQKGSQPEQSSSQEVPTQTVDSQTDQINTAHALVTRLDNRDFSVIAGTWKNDLGEILIIEADGSFTLDYKKADGSVTRGHDKIGTGFIKDGCYLANITGAGFIVTPASVKNIHIGTVYNQDSIAIGQSVHADEHPFYRQ
ncbi:DUF6287 domain-containing protein [Streptococcus porcinus]|uniref:Lipoprotein n=2 Tax=Streptococcus porcinus TaxID=1340 RepID=A0A4V0H4E6_STRPO|nr:DUF6287 domain-containing protein [Streptococcus porcinus]EGJ26414.1 conserved domain protein [Streptococcus porcinus str. Jelinkova 176]SQG43306.1 lipoprotein [Streptococcus porcinus]VTT42477.1 lipoprotein [Streptococcus porcinus]VTT43937.1 lipoprotein [Streptococcus porcinus]